MSLVITLPMNHWWVNAVCLIIAHLHTYQCVFLCCNRQYCWGGGGTSTGVFGTAGVEEGEGGTSTGVFGTAGVEEGLVQGCSVLLGWRRD